MDIASVNRMLKTNRFTFSVNGRSRIAVGFYYGTVAGLAGAIIGVVACGSWSVALVILLGLALVLLSLINFELSMYIWVVLTVITRWKWSSFGGHLRLDQVYLIIVLISGVIRFLSKIDSTEKTKNTDYSALLRLSVLPLVWVLLNLLTSVRVSPEPALSMRMVIWLAMDLLGYYLLLFALIKRWVKLDRVVQALVLSGACEGLYAAVSWIFHILVHTSFGVQPMMGYWSSYGTFYEANLLGSYEAVVLVLISDTNLSRRVKRLSYVFVVVGLVLSFTRGAWIGAIVGLFLISFRRSSLSSSRTIGKIGALFLLVGAVIIAVPFLPTYFISHGGTSVARLQNLTTLTTVLTGHPIFGMGTNSYGQRVFQGYISVWFVQVLYDTGITGLLTLATFLLWLIVKGFRLKSATSLATSLMVLTIAYQTTTGFWFSYSWVLLACITYVVTGRRGPSVDRVLQRREEG